MAELTVDYMLNKMLTKGASDLHLKVGNQPFYRVDGALIRDPEDPKLLPQDTQNLVLSIMDEEQKKAFQEDWEIDFALEVPGKARFRVNAFMQRGTMAAVFRVIPAKVKTIDDLNLPPICREFASKPRGMVLVTGPTGSGKSTTLAAMIDHVNKSRKDHIITIEDPIEFVHESQKSLVNQRQVGHDTDSFANALKSALRQDPDVVLIGEMRDLETIATAITTAETGHLVFGTLHTTGAAQTIDRVIDVFPHAQQQQIRMQLAGNIQGIISQILLPKLKGGRAAAFEILVPTGAIRNMIREAKTHQIFSIMQMGRKEGMVTMEMSLVDLVRKRLVDPKIAEAKAPNPELFNDILRGKV